MIEFVTPANVPRDTRTKAQRIADAEANTKRILIAAGHTPAWDEWRGVLTHHRVVCKNQHECWPRPSSIQSGRGPCNICAGNDSATAEANTKRILIEAGHTPAWVQWLGVHKPHKVFCKNGHECWPHPNHIQKGHGPCCICAGNDPATAEANIKKLLIEAGHTPAWSEWCGARTPHKVVCKNGHECWPLPNSIQQGMRPCGKCYIDHDVFYVVINYGASEVKLGVSSGNPRPRLTDHKHDSFDHIVYLLRNVDADPIERSILAALPCAGFSPVRGREYFPLQTLSKILELAEEFCYVSELDAA